MPHDESVGSGSDRSATPVSRLKEAVDGLPAWIRKIDDSALGEGLIDVRETIDRLEAVFADGLRRFDRSGEYAADGALNVVAWLRWKCRLSGGAAAERVDVARRLAELPQTQEAFARGDLGYQHVALITKTADQVGAAPVRRAEPELIQAAQSLDPSRFGVVTKNFQHRIDADGVLADANRAYARRYLQVGQSLDGLFHLDGLLDTEGGAALQTALNALSSPIKDDDRSPGQRRADALVELCRRQLDGGGLPEVGGQRPHLTIKASAETLAGISGQPAGDLEWAPPIPAETVRRLACDAALTRIVGTGQTAEASHATRTIPPAMRRALAARDRGCQFEGCDRPDAWVDGHHVKHWADGGPTTMDNLTLLCRRHHRKVHEEGWQLKRETDGRVVAIAPPKLRSRAARLGGPSRTRTWHQRIMSPPL